MALHLNLSQVLLLHQGWQSYVIVVTSLVPTVVLSVSRITHDHLNRC